MNKHNTIAIIVAAGSGERLASPVPKQYLPLAGTPLLRHSAIAFLNHPKIDAVLVVYNPENQEHYAKAVGDLPLLEPVTGGKTRQESVRLGLEFIARYQPEKVLIHDAARPLVDARIISDVISAIEPGSGVIPVLPLEDTIKFMADGKVSHTVSRETLLRAQTPQGFDYAELLQANKIILRPCPPPTAAVNFTDDASIFEHLGKTIKTVAGSHNNFKITTIDDLHRAELLMADSFETRVGMGFDAHKFCAAKLAVDNSIMLCGVPVPHPFSLEGHSDADVGLHAAVDAILGAIAAGDIGTHFPPGNPEWKGADSAIFLAHAGKLLHERRGQIINLDLTIICEKPKLLPHRDKMCETIAKILAIEKSRVSVKATTTEGMGFTGRSEGIAAQAVVSVRVIKTD